METSLTNVDNSGAGQGPGKGLVIRGLNHPPMNPKSSLLSEKGRERQGNLHLEEAPFGGRSILKAVAASTS